MILEVVDPSGARTRHRLDGLPLTIGRALANDLVLEDPYVDARHARIAIDQSGALLIEDLGSVNGLVTDAARAAGLVRIAPGSEIRVGRTVLRFRDPDEPVPPALVDDRPTDAFARPGASRQGTLRPVSLLPARQPSTKVGRLLATTPGRLGLAVAAIAAFALNSWLGNTERAAGSEVFAAALGVAVVGALWAGAWAIGSRAIVHRFNFVGHLAVVATVALLGLVWAAMNEWLTFYFPDRGAIDVLATGVGVALFVVLIAWHLSLSSTMPPRRQWRAAAITAGVIFGLGALSSLTEDDSFSDVPTFSGIVKPVGAGWMPTSSMDEFGAVMRELKDDVDEMAAKKD